MMDNRVRSSPAMEREIGGFLLRTGQTVECVFTHGMVTSLDYAMPLAPSPCVCGAAL